MAAKIIDGKAIAAEVNEETRRRVEALRAAGRIPGLAVVLVGDDPASQVYVNAKAKKCAELGIHSDKRVLPADATPRSTRPRTSTASASAMSGSC